MGSSHADAVESLRTARERIAALEGPEGAFVVTCRNSGVRPEPVTDATFECSADAERACVAARRYRQAMRELDPDLTDHALVVSRVDRGTVEFASVRERTDRRRENGLPRTSRTVTLAGNGDDEWLRVENAPVVHFAGPESLLDDEFVTRQLDAKLGCDP